MAPTILRLSDGRVDNIARAQRTKSIFTTPAERQWRDLNDFAWKWKMEFEALEAQGYLVGGRNAAPLDLFCLCTTYLDAI